ncbi:MAG: uracil-DNA glycosylase family protein [Thaumarchaeota archaeon]|nr:uracil-DNA glycosylase family protein [Candidatus Geocrenenecus arthurdayi]
MSHQTCFSNLQLRIQECTKCNFSKSFEKESLDEHNIPPHWSWWFKNKWPSKRNFYYTFFKPDGSTNIVFITLRPSTEWVPGTADFFLANALKANSLVRERFELEGDTFIFYEGVLVTDLIKCRGKAKEDVKRIPENCLMFLNEELAIIRECSKKEPKIIAVGERAQELLYKHGSELGVRVYENRSNVPRIWLHNYAVRQGKQNMKKSEAFEKNVRQIGEAVAKAKPMRSDFFSNS